jgi:hypothetical protein
MWNVPEEMDAGGGENAPLMRAEYIQNSSAMLPGPNPNSLLKYPPKTRTQNRGNRMVKPKWQQWIQAAGSEDGIRDVNSNKTRNIMMERPNGLCVCKHH